MLDTFGGYPVIVTMDAVERSDERLFPYSRHRSKRILKKLIKRFGGEYRMTPCAYKDERTRRIYMHPDLRRALELERAYASNDRAFYSRFLQK
jgi:hypothetical protein